MNAVLNLYVCAGSVRERGKTVEEGRVGKPEAPRSEGWSEGTTRVKRQAGNQVLVQVLMTRNSWATSQ